MARTRPGRSVLREAGGNATLGGCAAFLGALLPLLVSGVRPGYSWLAVAAAIGLLATLGVVLAWTFDGRPTVWAAALAAGGVVLIGVGVTLRIV